MNGLALLTALLWGAFCGYAGLRLIEAGINLISAIHGIFSRRWKSLVNKAMPGQIAYGILFDLLLRMLIQAGLLGGLLLWGHEWVTRNTAFDYQDTALWIWAIAATLAALATLRSSLKKIVISWKIGHVHDFAQKRKRTLMLRR